MHAGLADAGCPYSAVTGLGSGGWHRDRKFGLNRPTTRLDTCSQGAAQGEAEIAGRCMRQAVPSTHVPAQPAQAQRASIQKHSPRSSP